MEPIWKGKQTNKTSNMCTSDKGKQTNKQTEVACVEAQMQGAVWSCIACRVQCTIHQSMRRSFRDALEIHQKSMEFDMQGCTLTAIAKSPAQVYPTMGDEVKDELDPISSRDKQRVVYIPTS